MRYLISFLFGVIGCCVMSAAGSVSVVKPGIETLRDNGFELLKGKRVGLITNPTGVDNDLKSTIDILHEAPQYQIGRAVQQECRDCPVSTLSRSSPRSMG